jgi:exosortase O
MTAAPLFEASQRLVGVPPTEHAAETRPGSRAIRLARRGFTALFWGSTAGLFGLASAAPVLWAFDMLGLPRIEDAWLFAGPAACLVASLMLAGRLAPPSRPASVSIALGALGAAFFINILPQLALSSTGLGLYGFTAMVPAWRRSWVRHACLAALCALLAPLAVSDETGVGFLLRIASTDAAALALRLLGVSTVSAHDVLIFENSMARVDAPCSGLKSLFVGAAFFLAASVVLRRRPSARWAALLAAFIGVLLAANILRIVLIVLIHEELGWADVADAVHAPLGVMTFGLSCAAAVAGLLRQASSAAPERPAPEPRRVGTLGALALASVIALTCAASPRSGQDAASEARLFPPADAGDFQEIGLSEAEARFFSPRSGAAARKWTFAADGLSGSMLLVRSTSLTGLHAPELCFEGGGLAVRDMVTRVTAREGSYRILTVGERRRQAMYWMQSRRRVTDSFLDRLVDYAWRGDEEWVLVSILFDANAPADDAARDAVFARMRRHVFEMMS